MSNLHDVVTSKIKAVVFICETFDIVRTNSCLHWVNIIRQLQSQFLYCMLQLWSISGQHLKTVLLKGTFGKYIFFSPDFHTFVTIDNAGLLYILTSLHMQW